MTAEVTAALDIARQLARAGIPIFVAPADASSKAGFSLPVGWQQTHADPSVVDSWRPGDALCMVTGHGLDVLDVDPRNGGDLAELEGMIPTSYGIVTTPSGGVHSFIASLGVAKHTNLRPGIDVQAGAPDGSGRGFVYLAPTVRPSKITGEPVGYRWVEGPHLEIWNARRAEDFTGEYLAEEIRQSRSGTSAGRVGGPDWWREFVASKEPQSAPAAEKAITEKLEEVRQWTTHQGTGFRSVLMRAALTLGGYVGGGYITEGDAWAKLEEACTAVWGTADQDDRTWIEQGLTDGALQPFYVYTAEDEQLYGEAAQAVAQTRSNPSRSIYRSLGNEPFDPQFAGHDQEYAEAVLRRTAVSVRYAADTGLWLVDLGGDKWSAPKSDLARYAIKQVARLMPLGDTDYPKSAADYTEGNWQAKRRAKLMSSTGSSAVASEMKAIVAAGDHASALELADLDTDPEILWAGRVPWDLRASLKGPVPGDLPEATPHLHSALCRPENRATPYWDALLKAVWPDPAVRAWVIRVLSIAITGYPDAALPILLGPGGVGKTSVISFIMLALGTYAHAANPKLISGESSHDDIIYSLKGRRLSFIDEAPSDARGPQERLKRYSGGGELTGSAKYQPSITFQPTHTLILTANHEPTLVDEAVRRRVRLIPCEGDGEEVRRARQAITPVVWNAEAPGVLAMLMREAAAWLADPDSALTSAAPDSIRSRADEIAEQQDPIRQWVIDACEDFPGGTKAHDLFVSFVGWCKDGNVPSNRIPNETVWGRELTKLGYPAKSRKDGRYRPLRVRTDGFFFGSELPIVGGGFSPGGGLGGGVEDKPSTLQNARSNPTLSSLVEGMEGIEVSYRDYERDGPYVKSIEGIESFPPPSKPITKSPLPAETRNPTLHPQPNPTTSSTKAQLKAQEKESARLEAIREAAGEVHPLPVVVDRAGHVIPCSVDQAGSIVHAALTRTDGALTVDVETSGYSVGHIHHKLRSVQLGDEVASVVFEPVRHDHLIRGLLETATTLHAHSASADLVPLAHAGLIDYEAGWAKMIDTVIPAKLGDPKSTGSDPALKKLALAVLGNEATAPAADEDREKVFKAGKWLTKGKPDTPPERLGWAQIETGCEAMLRYAASDVLDTAALAKRLPPVPGPVLERERIAEEMTARVGYYGIPIDHQRVIDLTDHHVTLQAQAGDAVRQFGIDNPGSGPQVAQKLLEMGAQLPVSEKGNPSVAEHVLTLLKRNGGECGALAGMVLDYRHSSTVLGLFLEPYRLMCELGDARVRPTIYTLGTDTGRMSSVRPNCQQLPKKGGVRSMYVADPGMCLIGADFSGVEIRGAAALSQDQTLLRFLTDGRDLHSEVALQAFGPDPEATAENNGVPTPRKADRYASKSLVFGRLYGGGVATLARQAGVTEPEAQRVIDTLDALTPRLSEWSNEMRQAVRQGRTQFPSYSGRIIHFPKDFPHKAPNYAIQGSCRELLVDGLIRWRDTRWGNSIVLPVHDEIIAMVPIEDAVEATETLVRCMESELYGVKIVADPGKREEWGSLYWRDST